MIAEVEENITQVLEANRDLFSWSRSDMPIINSKFHYHKLAIYLESRPVVQRKIKLDPLEWKIMDEDARKLLSAGFIREVEYTTWPANKVIVFPNDVHGIER